MSDSNTNTNTNTPQTQTQVTPPNPNPNNPTSAPPAKDDNQIVQRITVGGRTIEVRGTVNLEFTEVVQPQVPNPEPEPPGQTEPTKPTEGTVKKGGWGANMDPKSWIRTSMRDHPDQFKITDGTKNVATNFTTAETADNFIKYFQRHPDQVAVFFDVDDPNPPDTQGPPGQGGQQPLPDVVGTLPYQTTGVVLNSTFRGPTKRNYASGKPSDWTIEKNTKNIPFDNVLAVVDVTLGPASEWEHDDNINIKIGGQHMGSGWFSNGLSIYEGKTFLGTEKEHPSSKEHISGKTYGDQRGKRVQVASTYFKEQNRTEYWIFKDGKWEMCCGATDVGGFNPNTNDPTEVQCRIDGFAGKDKPPTIHSMTVHEIKMGP